jgi:hypothetical protein
VERLGGKRILPIPFSFMSYLNVYKSPFDAPFALACNSGSFAFVAVLFAAFSLLLDLAFFIPITFRKLSNRKRILSKIL